MADEERVRAWLSRLGRLTAASMTSDEAAEWLAEAAPMLASRFPDTTFTPASLEHAAAESRHLPTYGEIVALLRDWEPPGVVAIAARPGDLTAQEQAMAANWTRHADGDWGKIVPRDPSSSLHFELRFYRNSWDRVFKHLVANNDLARRIATRSGWMPPLRAAASSIHSETKRDGEIFP